MSRFVTGFLVFVGAGLFAASVASAQEFKRPAAGSIQLSFLPPPLEKATYSLGIYDAKTNKLVRRLQEYALEKDFTVGLNGLITAWDGKDDSGKPVPPGRYAARGYAVGPLKIEGEDILGNDWTADDENLRFTRVLAIALLPEDDGLMVVAAAASNTAIVARFSGDGKLVWHREDPDYKKLDKRADFAQWLPKIEENVFSVTVDGDERTYRLSDGIELSSQHHLVTGDRLKTSIFHVGKDAAGDDIISSIVTPGKDRTIWAVLPGGSLVQFSAQKERLRELAPVEGEPNIVAVAASTKGERLYLLEQKPGWQRVRGLAWVETKEENGHPVSTWQTFFERNIHAPGGASDPDHPTFAANGPIEISLDENPLAPGKSQLVRLIAVFDAKGSYLATKDGLRLRQVSERPNLEKAYLAKGKPPSPLDFFQYDGAATDQFSIKGVHRIMEFDAGEVELTANGEKTAEPKPTEPPDL